MKRSVDNLAITTLFVTLSVPLQAQPIGKFEEALPTSRYKSAIEESRARLNRLIDNGAPGVSVAVGVDGEVVWTEGFGYANVEMGALVTPLTKFLIGSVSKSMTSVAVGLLVERGQLDLNVPVQNYVRDFPVKAEGEITSLLLASHRSGIRHYRQGATSDFFSTEHYDNVLDSLQIFSQDPLLFPPGDRFSYSSYGYTLLSAVIEEASGKDFLAFMDEEVFAPLNLLNTAPNHHDLIIKHRAAPYSRRSTGEKLTNSPYVDNSNMWAGGGFLSTPSDLVRFGFGVLDGGLLTNETVELLMSPQTTMEGLSYGLGWHTSAAAGEGWIGHTGSSVGGESIFFVHPESRVAFAITCNVGSCYSDVRAEMESIGNLFVE